MIEHITYDNILLAIIIRSSFNEAGVTFFTSNNMSQQLAYMKHPHGKIIQPHVHNPVPREVLYTQEVLFIKSGKLQVDFYDKKQKYIKSRILMEGDIILLATGGHGFKVLEEVQMIEVKQGPYAGDQDKTRFNGIGPEKINIGD